MIPSTANAPRLRAAFCRAAALTIFFVGSIAAWAPTGMALTVPLVQEAAGGTREYLIKAAFVYELIKATRWPEQKSNQILLCVRGNDPFGSAWDSIRGRPVGTRHLQIKRLEGGTPIAGCDALLIGTSSRDWWDQIRPTLAARPVLTLSEMAGFSKAGGMVTMMNIDNKLRFDVNLSAVHRAGLNINTDALELANMIHAGTARAGVP